jgi:DNA adenine methylase
MKSIFRYPGGKTRTHVREWIGNHKPAGVVEYREPFVGGGGIFFHVGRLAEKAWLNDLHPGLMEVYLALRDRPDEFIAKCLEIAPQQSNDPLTDCGIRGGEPKNARLQAVFDSLKLNQDCDQALRYFFVNRTVHGSGRVNYDIPSRLYFSNPEGWNIVRTNALQLAAGLLKGVQLTCQDYEALFREDGSNVWIYADPPYVVNSGLSRSSQLYQYSFTLEDHERFSKVVRKCKHRVAVSYDADAGGLVRSLFTEKRFRIYEGHWNYAGTTESKKRRGRELLILNYEPPASIRIMEPIQVSDGLDITEATDFELLEAEIESGIQSGRDAFLRIGKALAAIRDSGRPSRRLYRATHQTFEDYCRDRWGFSSEHATRFIAAARSYETLKKTLPIGSVLPASESQVRELARCESDHQAAKVWKQVVESSKKITAAVIRKAVNAAIGYEPPKPDYFEQFCKLWEKLSNEQREQFLSDLRKESAA